MSRSAGRWTLHERQVASGIKACQQTMLCRVRVNHVNPAGCSGSRRRSFGKRRRSSRAWCQRWSTAASLYTVGDEITARVYRAIGRRRLNRGCSAARHTIRAGE